MHGEREKNVGFYLMSLKNPLKNKCARIMNLCRHLSACRSKCECTMRVPHSIRVWSVLNPICADAAVPVADKIRVRFLFMQQQKKWQPPKVQCVIMIIMSADEAGWGRKRYWIEYARAQTNKHIDNYIHPIKHQSNNIKFKYQKQRISHLESSQKYKMAD